MLVQRLSRIALLGSAWVLYLLLGLSVVSLAAAIERWVFFARRAGDVDALAGRFSDFLEAEDFDGARRVLRESRSIEAAIVLAALRWANGGARALADALDASLGRARGRLLRSSYLFGTLGNNAPFVGLLGTVIGVIDAFHQLGEVGQNRGAMGNVMVGISEALVATGVGLFVALPAVVAYNLIQKKIAEIETGVQVLGKLASAYIEAREHGGEPLPHVLGARGAARGAAAPAVATGTADTAPDAVPVVVTVDGSAYGEPAVPAQEG